MKRVDRRVVVSDWLGGDAIAVCHCPACGSEIRTLHASAVFDNLDPSSFDLWTVWRCQVCKSLYPSPRPSNDSLAAAYTNYYTHDAEPPITEDRGLRSVMAALVNGYMNRRFKATMTPTASIGFTLFKFIEPLRLKLDYHGRHLFLSGEGRGRRVLDVGSGNGEFLSRAERMGWDAAGIDPDSAAVEACRAQGLNAWRGFIGDDLAECAGPFDVITLRHSIEHVPNPRVDLAHCFRKLSSGGMLWLAWPNPCGPGASAFKSAWRGLEAPRHLCIPSAQAMRGMLAESGFVHIRLLRRGHHARSIARASSEIAAERPGIVNRIRRLLGPVDGYWADFAGTFGAAAGEELVMVAFAPEQKPAHE